MKYKITSLDMTRLEGQSFFQLLSDSLEAVNAFTKANKTELVYISKASVMDASWIRCRLLTSSPSNERNTATVCASRTGG